MKKVKNNQIPVKSLITNHGTKKYVTVEKTKARLNEQKIKEDSRWDGPRESSATWKISPLSNCSADTLFSIKS